MNKFIQILLLTNILFSSCTPSSNPTPSVTPTTQPTPTPTFGSVNDIDGNNYITVIIGSQTWMAENLRTTKYCNGDLITFNDSINVTDSISYWNYSFNDYFYGDSTLNLPYGKKYNYFAVTDSRNICPCNWRVPSKGEWAILRDYLGGYLVAGGKLKAIGTFQNNNGLWSTPNTGATNSSGFNALPDYTGTSFPGLTATYWTNTIGTPPGPSSYGSGWVQVLNNNNATLDVGTSWRYSRLSVRCIKN